MFEAIFFGDLVDLGKRPYLGPIVASLSQKFLISTHFPATATSSAKATSLVRRSFVKIKSSKEWSIGKMP